MSVQTQQIHRRKSSKDEDEINSINISNIPISPPPPSVEVTVPDQNDLPSVTIAPAPPRNRTHSTPPQSSYGHNRTPSSPNALPPSAGPFRTSFQPPPRQLVNGHGHPITSPFRSTFSGSMGPPPQMNGHSHSHAHSRTRSISTPFSPASPSPLSSSFPPMSSSISPPNSGVPHLSSSQSAPETLQHSEGQLQSPPPAGAPGGAAAAAKHNRRHSRMHSRNLSVFFPRPESLSHRTISEDGDPEGGQEVTIPVQVDDEALLVPSAGSSVSVPGSRRPRHSSQPITPLGQGFTFGGKLPPGMPTPEVMNAPRMSGSHSADSASSSTSKKRGHHHKHSLSHNFFSFLEPGGNVNGNSNGATTTMGREEELHTQPTPMPISPWGPISAIPPDSAAPSKSGSNVPSSSASPLNGHTRPHSHSHSHSRSTHTESEPRIESGALAGSITQFVLGAWLWVSGQQAGSLACTGLGYWVVFDSFGVALAGVVPGWLASGSERGGSSTSRERERIRRPYGNGRLETVLMFAQAVYLLFSSVYVCKETVEHVLLSAGGEGHHHHHGDEEGLGIDFPIFMIFITFVTLFGTALIFENNTKIVHITGNRIPSLSSLLRSIWSPSRHRHLNDPPPTTKLGLLISNPFVASPLFFCLAIVIIALFMPTAQHRSADLVLASIIAVVTFQVAYQACVVLGAVLLQTSPPRGLTNGKMEAFLRAMREVERHPQVLHLPAPHIWQLTPTYTSLPPANSKSAGAGPSASSSPISSLVITLELHVREDLGDEDVLKLTRWAWERCVNAIIGGGGAGGSAGIVNLRDVKEMGEDGPGVPEVTVGVVRG